MTSTNHHQPATLSLFFLTTLSLALLLCGSYLPQSSMTGLWIAFFTLTMTMSYGALYLVPAAGLTALSHRFMHHLYPQTWSRKRDAVIYGVAIITTSATLILLFADRVIFKLFNFHLNGFVWNLIITPGGIESMGSNGMTSLTYGLFGLGIVCLQIILLTLSRWLCLQNKSPINGIIQRSRMTAILLLIIAVPSQALMFGVSSFQNNLPVLNTATALPLYQPLTLKGLAKRLGFKKPYAREVHLQPGEGSVAYPLQPLQIEKPAQPLNIVWLVAESWRHGMITPEIMPNMTSFANQATTFQQHYSGGNGTRMGLFSQFYGLYGSYWFQFLNERQEPVIMDVLQQQDYQLSLYTSAQFSYPEFDKTLFASIPKESLHETGAGPGWQRDRENVSHMLSFIKKRDPNRPFMTFMFFESPHARYYFPEEDAIRKPYLEDFNYATMSLEKDMDLFFNRYVNACHHLDSQLARVTDYLKAENLLENTIVIITGDHGEEFMENGHWGHNSEFTEQQVRVPLLLWVPGMERQDIKRMTSHLDIPATLLPLLGVKNPARDYSLGYNLLGKKQREYTIISDWSRIAYIDDNIKAVFPFSTKSISKSYLTTKQDSPMAKQKTFWQNRRKTLVEILNNLHLFLTTTL